MGWWYGDGATADLVEIKSLGLYGRIGKGNCATGPSGGASVEMAAAVTPGGTASVPPLRATH